MMRIALNGAVLALGIVAVGCAGSKPEVKTTPPPIAAAPPAVEVVVTPSAAPAPEASPPRLDAIHFDFDTSLIREDDQDTLEGIGQYLADDAEHTLTISGHTDERGTVEYNIALGDRRAQAARDFIVRLGVDAQRIRTISYGKAQPVDSGHDEAAWAKNRRDDFQLELKQQAQAKP